MRLSLAMGRTVGELIETMSAGELTMWRRYDECEPIGDRRADMRAALVAAWARNAGLDVASALGAKVTARGGYDVEDFMLRFGAEGDEDGLDLDKLTAAIRADPFTTTERDSG